MLRVLAIADVHSPDAFTMPLLRRRHVDLVVTLGDISQEVLDTILDRARNVPCIGVPGNHDERVLHGVVDLHRTTRDLAGIRFGGFGGARRYKRGPHQYTDLAVALGMRLMRRCDVFLSHAPPLATSRNEGPVHRGFSAFDRYIQRARPAYWLHGHLERCYSTRVHDTQVIGVAGKQVLVLDV